MGTATIALSLANQTTEDVLVVHALGVMGTTAVVLSLANRTTVDIAVYHGIGVMGTATIALSLANLVITEDVVDAQCLGVFVFAFN